MATRTQRWRYHARALAGPAFTAVTLLLIADGHLRGWVVAAAVVVFAVLAELRVVWAYRTGYTMAVHAVHRSMEEGQSLIPDSSEDLHPADSDALLRAFWQAHRDQD